MKISDYNDIFFLDPAGDFDDFFDPAEEFDVYFNLSDGLNEYRLVFIVGQSPKKEKIAFQSKENVFRALLC